MSNNNRHQFFAPGSTPNTLVPRYGYMSPQNRMYQDSNFQNRIPVGSVVHTTGGTYQLTSNGGQRVQPQPAPNFMSQNNFQTQAHANNMRQLQTNALHSAIAQNNFAAQQRVQDYNNMRREVNQTAEERARQAYVQRLRSMNSLPRLLQAQGISGGAAESTAARMSSNFDNLQFGIMQNRDNELFNIQNRIAQARTLAAQNEANIRSQHAMQQMQLEQNLEDRRMQAFDRERADWERQRQEMIATIPQHYDDFQAHINYLRAVGDPYNLIPHVTMARNEKIRNQELETESRQAEDEARFNQYLTTIQALPPHMIWNHMLHYEPNSWVYNVLRGFYEAAIERERLIRQNIETHNANTAHRWGLVR
ncbi:MAG: hypothetical protein FWE04_02505 [Oscillospiraceae bacterium]|nr:hypothetical protein [Oscillospiraceae bacterium]